MAESHPTERDGHEVYVRFGAGLNSHASAQAIADHECAAGSKNFDLDFGNTAHRRRPPFSLIATAPNGEPIYGFAQLVKTGGNRTTLVQAGPTVYSWDGGTGFTVVGTVSSGSRLRGPASHRWSLGTEKVIITDLRLQSDLMEWDGTTFQEVPHNLGGSFRAKYCAIAGDRAIYANVAAGGLLPHVVAGSERDDYSALNVDNRAGAAGVTDSNPFFVTAPDLFPINGLVGAFGLLVISTGTREGSIHKMTGVDATDFAVESLFAGAGGDGDEPMVSIGNDILIARVAQIETLFATEKFGDTQVDDINSFIRDETEGLGDWSCYYVRDYHKVVMFSKNDDRAFVIDKDTLDERIRAASRREAVAKQSPWMIWDTEHAFSMQPTSAMVMIDPSSGNENLLMGGPDGAIYRLFGDGEQDGGTTDIKSVWRSKVFNVPNKNAHKIAGYVSAKRSGSGPITIRILWQGHEIYNSEVMVSITGLDDDISWGGEAYFGGDYYYGAQFEGRLKRYPINPTGISDEFQIEIETEVTNTPLIEEIFLEFFGNK